MEWVAFEKVLQRWTSAIQSMVTVRHQRPPNPSAGWSRRHRSDSCAPPPSPSPVPDEASQEPSQGTGGVPQDEPVEPLRRHFTNGCIRRSPARVSDGCSTTNHLCIVPSWRLTLSPTLHQRKRQPRPLLLHPNGCFIWMQWTQMTSR